MFGKTVRVCVTPDSRVRVVLSLRSGLVLTLVVCGEVGQSTASLANQAPVFCGCPAGIHGCDLVSRVRTDQSANPVVVWLGLVSRVREVILETWHMRKSQHPSSTRSWSPRWSTLGSSFQPHFNTAILIRSHGFCCSTPPVESLARSDLDPSSSFH